MTFIVPNEECFIGFHPDGLPADLCAPTMAEIGATVDLTCFVQSINATAQGNTVPTPVLCSLFERQVPGTSNATFTAEFYRDKDLVTTPGSITDLAWDTLYRKRTGAFIIGRFGITYDQGVPVVGGGDQVEVWPVEITSRAAGPMSSGTPMMFSITCAVNIEPCEDAVVAAI